MAKWTIERAKAAAKKAHSAKSSSDAIYREAMELVFPDRENFNTSAEGQKKASKNWDSTATVSLIKAANRLSSDFTPQFSSWFEIGTGAAAEQMPDQAFKSATGSTKDDVKAELEAVTKVVQAIFNGPGFPTASNEMYLDWYFGQGGMQIMPNDDLIGEPVIFSSLPLSHFYAIEGPNGRLDQWFFWHEVRADVIKAQWADAVLGDYIIEEAAKPSPKKIKLVSIVYRDYDEKKPTFRYEVFHFHSDKTKMKRLVERTSRTSPFVTPRYSKLAGENGGRGPVIFAMPDIRTTNKIVELTLRAVSIAVMGIYTATDGVQNPISLKPLSIIKVRRNGGPDGPSLQRLDIPQRIDYGDLVLEKLQESIRKIIGDGGLPPEAGPIRTATEFIQRSRELIADQAGGLGRLTSEFVVPAVQRVIDILEAKQLLPTDGLTIDQFLIEVRMTSPLARGEAMQEVENIVNFIEILKSIGGDQMVQYEMDMKKTTSKLGDLMEVPRLLRTTKEQKAKIEKAIAQIAAAEAGGDPEQAGQQVEQENEDQIDGK